MSKHRIRSVIVDDEALARQMILEYLWDYPQVEVVAECSSGREAVRTVNSMQPELLFLDVQMPELNGFEVLEQLQQIPFVIFSTAYDQYALQAFEVNAVDYLLKPYDRSRFHQAVQRALERIRNKETASELLALLNSLQVHQGKTQRFWVKESGSLIPVQARDINWVEAMDDYVCLHVGKSKHLVSQTMRELEARLDPKMFMRIHRSTIVNLDRIKELRSIGDGSYRVILKDGTELSLSRGQAKKLRELIL